MVSEYLLHYEVHCAKCAKLFKQWSLPVMSAWLVGRVDAMESEKTGYSA